MYSNLVFFVPEESKKREALKEFILKHPELKFVSLSGVDFLGNDTDERIPIEYFLKNLEDIFCGGVQTDGSSVNLPGIATLSDAKIDFIIDFDRKWFIDYNFDYTNESGIPIGTIRIPIYFKHHEEFYCSRSVMRDTLSYLKGEIMKLMIADRAFLINYGISDTDIEDIYFTLGTELEFWVRTTLDTVSAQDLAVSQLLKESYWKRTKGQIRTCLEEALTLLQEYGLEPEMGHKEVGGVKGKISPDGMLYNVMEQLEIDWRFDEPMQAADNELFARIIIKEVFRRHGLEASVMAKPVEGVAGNGEHMHVGIGIKLKDGKRINLFAPTNQKMFLSNFGYGSLMGILRHWRHVNPFVSNSNSALKRLQPGFEAPVSVVASLGANPESPSRNRTVLTGLVRSDNPLSVRFEVRAPNPHTNTYLAVTSFYLSMLDGMKYSSGKTAQQLHEEIYKKKGDKASYLEEDREYISELDVFDDFSEEGRQSLYGKAPETVWEVISPLKEENIIYNNTPLKPEIVNSFYLSSLNKWVVELKQKEIPTIRMYIAAMKRYDSKENDYDRSLWNKIDELRFAIAKDEVSSKSMMTRLEEHLDKEEFDKASSLWLEIKSTFDELKEWEIQYLRNII